MPEAETKLPRLRKALKRARLDFNDTMSRIRAGLVQIHDIPEAVGLTCITVSGEYRTCYIIAVAGERAGLAPLAAIIESFARANNCQVIETDGRKGFKRLHNHLADGYAPSAVKFRKYLEV